MGALRRSAAAAALALVVGTTAGCGAVQVGVATLTRADDGRLVLLVEMCEDDHPVERLTLTTRGSFHDVVDVPVDPARATSFSVVLDGLDLAALDPLLVLDPWGATDDVSYVVAGPPARVSDLLALEPGQVVDRGDPADPDARSVVRTTSEQAWRDQACGGDEEPGS